LDADLTRNDFIDSIVQAARRRIPAQPGRTASESSRKSGGGSGAVFLFWRARTHRHPPFTRLVWI